MLNIKVQKVRSDNIQLLSSKVFAQKVAVTITLIVVLISNLLVQVAQIAIRK